MDSVSRHRLLTIFPSSDAVLSSAGADDDLTEDDVFWTNDVTEQTAVNSPADKNNEAATNHRRTSSFNRNSGILAALPESNNHSVLSRKSSIPSSSKSIPFIPRTTTERDYASLSQSLPARKMNQSAPVNVPLLSIAMAKRRNSRFLEVDDEIDDGEEEEKLPPHEFVARGSRNSPQTTFSVLEGVGRTLKGRDLRQVRNAVWRQTGFLD